MDTVRIAIVGGGLSGLYAAYLLERQGIDDYLLLEARPGFGGRIVSLPPAGTSDPAAGSDRDNRNRFDLGPTWFWPALQPELDRLVAALDLERFAQYETGDMIVERARHEAPMRMPAYAASPPSMRVAGGMAALTDALRDRLAPARLAPAHTVRCMRRTAKHVELDAEDAQGRRASWQADRVLLAVPPRLAATTIDFMPALPDALSRDWRDTPTWMAPHAKYVAVYDTPFWRAQGLSGAARSAVGPLVEIHDASMPGASAALFGFIGVPARTRISVSDELLRTHCRAQMARLFGPQAARPEAEFIKDWAADPLTATVADQDGGGQHGAAPAATAASGPWRDCLAGIASEWSLRFPGYVAGAIEAAARGVLAATGNGHQERH